MKKILRLFTAISFITLALSSLHAMDPAPVQPTYSLVKTFHVQQYFDTITVIKRLSDQYIVAFNRKGRCKLFDVHNDYREMKPQKSLFSQESSSANNVFFYEDSNKDPLLISSHRKGLDVFDVISGIHDQVNIDYKFSLYQKTDGALAMVNWTDRSACIIDIHFKKWNACLEIIKPIRLEDLWVRDEGFIVSALMLDAGEQPKLPENLFDIASLTEEECKGITYMSVQSGKKALDKIKCYHKMPNDQIIVAHDSGTISIWKKK